MTIEEAEAQLEQAIANITSGNVQAYWQAFKTFCSLPIENEGQSLVLTCLTADFPMSGHAFYITFKRPIWSLDEEGEMVVDQIIFNLACKPSSQTQSLNVNLGGEPLSDQEFAQMVNTIEKSLEAHNLYNLLPMKSSVYII